MSASKRLSVLALVLGLLAVLAPASVADDIGPGDLPAGDRAGVERVAGQQRRETAIEIAEATFGTDIPTVLLARDQLFPDSLSGAYAAGVLNAPTLLTRTEELSPDTAEALGDFGVQRVVILGGGVAVSTATAAQIRALGIQTDRIAGPTRFDTAVRIADFGQGQVGEADLGSGALRTGIVTTGMDFADALAAGPLAYAGNHPVFLVTGDRLPAATRAALTDATLDIQQVIIAGGTAAVSQDVEQQIEDLGVGVVRIAGADRYETSAELALATTDVLGWDDTTINLARGDDFADALTLAPLAGETESAVVLTGTPDALAAPTFDYLQDGCGGIDTLVVAGGPGAVDGNVATSAQLASGCALVAAPLSGDQEVSSGDPDGSGTFHLFSDGSSLCLALAVDEVAPPTAAHLHASPAGQDGPVVVDLEADFELGLSVSCAEDDDVDGAALSTATGLDLDGTEPEFVAQGIASPANFYVNVHNAEYPAGALRGQLDPPTNFPATTMSAAKETDGTDFATSSESGTALARTYPGSNGSVCVFVDANGLTSPAQAMHVHTGRVDQVGAVVVDLGVGHPRTGSFTHLACGTPEDDAPGTTRSEILTQGEGHYLNLHTTAEPAGAVRGQVAPDFVFFAFGSLEHDDDPATPGSQITGPEDFDQGDPDARAPTLVSVGADQDVACVEMFPENVDGTTFDAGGQGAVHIHQGSVTENGPIVVSFDVAAGQDPNAGLFSCDQSVDAAAMADVVADPGGHYLNLHTTAFNAGAARGQLAGIAATIATGRDGQNLTATNDVQLNSSSDIAVLCATIAQSGLDSNTTAAEVTTNVGGPPFFTLLGPGAAIAPDAFPLARCVESPGPPPIGAERFTFHHVTENFPGDALVGDFDQPETDPSTLGVG